MKTSREVTDIAINTIRIEADAVHALASRIDKQFTEIVTQILQLKGRVIITGIGKSAIIAQKIVSTFNSTGTPAIFMHAADAIHGDLGMIQQHDLVMCISKSGNTPEIKLLVPLLKQANTILVGMVGDTSSYLARQADYILDTTIKTEACPHNLAPTTSTTAQLVMGDALAVCLLQSRDFSTADFARYHPGGSLGKRLYLKVADLAAHNEKPAVTPAAPVREVLVEITKNRLGAVAVVENKLMKGIITDGDIRRMMENHRSIDGLTAADIMGRHPKMIDVDELAVNALELMRNQNITQVLATANGSYAGIVHLHDLLKEGIL